MHFVPKLTSNCPPRAPSSSGRLSHQIQNHRPLSRVRKRREFTRVTTHRHAWTGLVAVRRARILGCRAGGVSCLLSPLQRPNGGQFPNREDGIDRLGDGFELVLVLGNSMDVLFQYWSLSVFRDVMVAWCGSRVLVPEADPPAMLGPARDMLRQVSQGEILLEKYEARHHFHLVEQSLSSPLSPSGDHQSLLEPCRFGNSSKRGFPLLYNDVSLSSFSPSLLPFFTQFHYHDRQFCFGGSPPKQH